LEVPDLDLVRSAVAGDDGAFHALVDRHAKVLFRVALSLSRNRSDAEDLMQETLVAAYRGLKNFEGRSSVKTWFTTIMTRQAYKVWRKSKRGGSSVKSIHATTTNTDDRERTAEGVDAAMVVGESTAAVQKRLDVTHVLGRLTDAHRQVLVLREIQGLSYDEIAQALGVPRGTVESRLFRARAEFRQEYERDERDEAADAEARRSRSRVTPGEAS
jgi:RNA polymerase sigma-70 factor (ECF subfamily)